MSRETLEHLNTQTLIGYADKRGHAWHYRKAAQGAESNHYNGAIPVEDVRRRLLNWEAIEGEITATALTPDGVLTYRDTERKAIMRSDNGRLLGIFKQGYKIHQFDEWLIQNVETLLDADLAIGSAGLLKGGAVAWIQVEMEETITAPNGIEFRPFLTAATSMDGSLATTYQTGAQVVVCDNTLSAALAEKVTRVKVKHSRHSLNKIQDVRDALDIVHGVADDFIAQVDALTAQVVTQDQWRAFVDAYSAGGESGRAKTIAERKAGDLHRLWNHDERVAPWRGSAYGVVQAVNTYVHHLGTVRNVSRADRNAERAITGGADALDASTLALLATV